MRWRAEASDCVNHATGEERAFANVVPEQYSGERIHELHPECWCEPEQTEDGLLIHRAAH